MPSVLTMGSTVLCGPLTPAGVPIPPHVGKVITISTAKLTVQGQPVLLETSIAGQTITGCLVPAPGVACTAVTSIATTRSLKLLVKGSPVLLEPLTGVTAGNPAGTLGAQANQIKLTAI